MKKPNGNNPDSDHEDHDRRVFERMRAEVACSCRCEAMESTGMTFDISAQGVGFVTPNWLRPNMRLDICLRLPFSKEEFLTSGTVVWCRRMDTKRFRLGLNLDKPELMIVSQLLAGLPKNS